MARTLINMPPTAKRGDVIQITTLIAHPMETGLRAGENGQLVPRNIVQRFSCRYNGEVVFSAALHTAVSANPYLAFSTVAVDSGTLSFTWEGDGGFTQTETLPLSVT